MSVTLNASSMQLEDFLKHQSYFSLGHLPTERLHPETVNLSDRVKSDPAGALTTLQKIDLHAIEVVKDQIPLIHELSHDIAKTFSSGHRVFLSGCGATGRLALALESLYRKMHVNTARENQVQALMAGGDFALVKSVENFEDYPQYGIRHLLDLGFKDGDLLIAITEGGETPYVIGTLEGALNHSHLRHWFVYCNPTDVLIETVERAREVIENPRVNTLCLMTGPMALSGSTRLQAASSQMLAVGAALFQNLPAISLFLEEFAKLDLANFLNPVVLWEANQYQKDHTVLYETDAYPIAVLTDTTERSPTFSLAPFESSAAKSEIPSLCYLSIPSANDAETAWHRILNRKPIGLNWDEFKGRLDEESILEFNFSAQAKSQRAERVRPKKQAVLKVLKEENAILLQSDSITSRLDTRLVNDPLCEQLLIKIILNTLSLMVMAHLNRYEGNVMTWVRASNGKLVDRTLRYLDFLIDKRGLLKPKREDLIRTVFSTKETLAPNEALILSVLKSLSKA